MLTAEATASTLSGIVTGDMLSGVMSEVIGLLPVIVPVMITYIALRKGIAFLGSVLRRA